MASNASTAPTSAASESAPSGAASGTSTEIAPRPPPKSPKKSRPTVADTITAGKSLRGQKMSMPKRTARQVPIPANPRGLVPTDRDVKMSRRAMIRQARCLRTHNIVLSDRMDELSKPTRRQLICMWRNYANILSPEQIYNLQNMLDASDPFKPDQAYEYFVSLRRQRKRAEEKEKAAAGGKKDAKKDLSALCGDRRFAWARSATVAFARGIQHRLGRPGAFELEDGMLRLSDIVLTEICSYSKMKPPSRRSTHPKAKFMLEMADKIAVWIDEILAESDERMLMMDFDEDEVVEHADEPVVDGFADEFLNMMAGKGRLLMAPKPAYLKFTGPMLEAFKALTNAMYNKGAANLITHGKFSQSYKEGADDLRSAQNLNATDFDTAVANDIAKKMDAITKNVAVGDMEQPMKDIINICSEYLAQIAQYNKDKGVAFRYLLQKMREQPDEILCNKGKITKTMGEGAQDLDDAKGLETDHDDLKLTEHIRTALDKITHDVPSELRDEMPGTLDLASKYLSQKTVDDSERGSAFDKMIEILKKNGAKPFAPGYPALNTAYEAAFVLKNAPGLTSIKPDPATVPMFSTILHKYVDPGTTSDMLEEMAEVIQRCANYLSGFARDREKVQAILVKMMKNNHQTEAARRNNVAMTYGDGVKEFEHSPVMIPLLPVKDINKEITGKLNKDVASLTPEELKGAMQRITNDAGGDISQDVALMSGAAGERYGRNLLAAAADTKGDEQLFKTGPYGMTFAEAGEAMRNAGTLDQPTDPKTQALRQEIAKNLRKAVDDTVSKGTANRLDPTINAVASHLAKRGTEMADALTYLLDKMTLKGEEPMAKIQGIQHTYLDCVKKIVRATTLANDQVDKGIYENVRSKLKDVMIEHPAPQYDNIMPGLIDEVARFLAKPKPESEEEQKQLLHDILLLKGSGLFHIEGVYKITCKEVAQEIMKAPTGGAAQTKAGGLPGPDDIYVDPNKRQEMSDKLEAAIGHKITDKALKQQLKAQLEDKAHHLGEVVVGRKEAMEAIQQELVKKGHTPLTSFKDTKMTHGEGAESLNVAEHFAKKAAPPGLSDQVKKQLQNLPADAGTSGGAKHMKSTMQMTADYIAAEAGRRGGYVPPPGSEEYKIGAAGGGAGGGVGGGPGDAGGAGRSADGSGSGAGGRFGTGAGGGADGTGSGAGGRFGTGAGGGADGTGTGAGGRFGAGAGGGADGTGAGTGGGLGAGADSGADGTGTGAGVRFGAGAGGGADGTGAGTGGGFGAGAGSGADGTGTGAGGRFGTGADGTGTGAGGGADGTGGRFGAGAGGGADGTGAGAGSRFGAGVGGGAGGGVDGTGTGAGGRFGTGADGGADGTGSGAGGRFGTGAGGGADGTGTGAGGRFGTGAEGGADGTGTGAGGRFGTGAGGGAGGGADGTGTGAGGRFGTGTDGSADGTGTGAGGRFGTGAGGGGADGTGTGSGGRFGTGADGGADGIGTGAGGRFGTGAGSGADGTGTGAGGRFGTGAGSGADGTGTGAGGRFGMGADGTGTGAGGRFGMGVDGTGTGAGGGSGAGAGGGVGRGATELTEAERAKRRADAERANRLSEIRRRVASGERGVHDKEHGDANKHLIEQLRRKGNDTFHRQGQIELANKGAADILEKELFKADKAVSDAPETDKLARKLERRLSSIAEGTTPPHLRDAMTDVIIESARTLAEYYIFQSYAAAVSDALIDGMQRKDNEILVDENGDTESFFYAAQRLKKVKTLSSRDPHAKLSREIAKKLEECIKCRTMARKLSGTMKDHIKNSADYLSEHVLDRDPEIDAFIDLLTEMEEANEQPIVTKPMLQSYKDAAAYLKTLTSFEDKIGRKDKNVQGQIESKMKSLMAKVPLDQYTPAIRDQVITQQAGLLTSYLLLQGEKSDVLKALIERMEETPDAMILRHGPERKSFFEATEALHGKTMEQLQDVKNPDPVVVRKLQLKLMNIMASDVDKPFMTAVIDDVSNYLAVHLLHPQVIRVCKCSKSVLTQCELWNDEILRRVTRPCCTCSQGRIPDRSGMSFQIGIKECPSMATATQDEPSPCPAYKDNTPCLATSSSAYVVQAVPHFEPASHLSPTRLTSQSTGKLTPGAQLALSFTTMGQLTCSNSARLSYNTDSVSINRRRSPSPTFSSPAAPSSSTSTSRFLRSPCTMFVTMPDRQTRFTTRTHARTRTSTSVKTKLMARSRRSEKPDKHSDAPVVTTDQMSDLYAMMVSLMWNVQAWRDWLQENLDRALASHDDEQNVLPDKADAEWMTFRKRVLMDASQWLQYIKFSQQLTLRLEHRYKDKQIVSPTRATVKTRAYLECQKEMLGITDMFNEWTHWLMTVLKETELLQKDPNENVPLHILCRNHFKNKVEQSIQDWIKYNTHLNICWEHKYISIMSAWEQEGPVWVMSAYGAVPSGAAAAGKCDEEIIWVARTTHNSEVLPGALLPSKHCCIIYADGAVHNYTKYQVLCNAAVKWMSWRATSRVDSEACAVCVAPGVHVGRVQFHERYLVGPVVAPQYRCHVLIHGHSYNFDCFELLVLIQEGEGSCTQDSAPPPL